MNINFSDQNCLTRYRWNPLTGQTGIDAQNIPGHTDVFCLFCCFMSQSTATVMSGQSVHLTTLFFLDKLEQAVNQYFMHILSLLTYRCVDKQEVCFCERQYLNILRQ